MSTTRKVRVPVDLSNLSATEAKKVEMVLRRAERIKGNGAIFERLNSGTLVCRNTQLRDPKELVSKLVDIALLSPVRKGPFASNRKRQETKNLKRWKTTRGQLHIEIEVCII